MSIYRRCSHNDSPGEDAETLMTPLLEASPPAYVPRYPSQTVLYRVVADHLETFLASLDADLDARGLPAYVAREFYDYLQCGVLAYGFLRLGCDTCPKELLLAFSCKRRGFCPSCAGRRMAQTAAHLVERVIPWVPTRQWVVSVPVPLRYWMAASQDLSAGSHHHPHHHWAVLLWFNRSGHRDKRGKMGLGGVD
jgi:Transposase zinc-binding domain